MKQLQAWKNHNLRNLDGIFYERSSEKKLNQFLKHMMLSFILVYCHKQLAIEVISNF